jgi:hypothetical protein
MLLLLRLSLLVTACTSLILKPARSASRIMILRASTTPRLIPYSAEVESVAPMTYAELAEAAEFWGCKIEMKVSFFEHYYCLVHSSFLSLEGLGSSLPSGVEEESVEKDRRSRRGVRQL